VIGDGNSQIIDERLLFSFVNDWMLFFLWQITNFLATYGERFFTIF